MFNERANILETTLSVPVGEGLSWQQTLTLSPAHGMHIRQPPRAMKAILTELHANFLMKVYIIHIY